MRIEIEGKVVHVYGNDGMEWTVPFESAEDLGNIILQAWRFITEGV